MRREDGKAFVTKFRPRAIIVVCGVILFQIIHTIILISFNVMGYAMWCRRTTHIHGRVTPNPICRHPPPYKYQISQFFNPTNLHSFVSFLVQIPCLALHVAMRGGLSGPFPDILRSFPGSASLPKSLDSQGEAPFSGLFRLFRNKERTLFHYVFFRKLTSPWLPSHALLRTQHAS